MSQFRASSRPVSMTPCLLTAAVMTACGGGDGSAADEGLESAETRNKLPGTKGGNAPMPAPVPSGLPGAPVFAEHIEAKYGAEPGFITMNLPMLADALDQVGIHNPIICTNVNKIGFRMCGGIGAYCKVIGSKRCRVIAMSAFASGAIPPAEAIDWVCNLQGLHSVVFGASSPANIRQTLQLIEQRWKLRSAP